VSLPQRTFPKVNPLIRTLSEPNSCATPVLAEQHDEWTEGRRYLAPPRPRPRPAPTEQDRHEEVTDLKALSA
jgi:hypothetical protein